LPPTTEPGRFIDEHGSTLVPSDYFDRLLAALDEAAKSSPSFAARPERVSKAGVEQF